MTIDRTRFVQVPVWVLDHEDVTPAVLGTYVHALRAAEFHGDRELKATWAQIAETSGRSRPSVNRHLAVLRSIEAIIERDGHAFLPLDDPVDVAQKRSAPAQKRSSRRAKTIDAPLSPDLQEEIEPSAADAAAGESIEGVGVAEPPEPPLSHRIVNRLWERSNPKPAVQWIALVKLVERFLDAGWTDQQVYRALTETAAFTVNAIEFQLRGGRGGTNTPGHGPRMVVDREVEEQRRAEPSGRLTEEDLWQSPTDP